MIRNARYALRPALLAIVLAVVACRGESPTAPTQTGNGGTPPPTGAAINLSVSNSSPLTGSTTDISALVTLNGSAVPNGTAVEFSTDIGVFTDTNSATTIRTTTNGVAVATLTDTSAGTSVITVRVNNVQKQVSVTFKDMPPGLPPPPDKTVTISSFDPPTAAPTGGQVLTITGTNFAQPVRVLFGTVDARVLSVSPTQIKVIIPPINLGPGAQAIAVSIIVISSSGSTGEQRVTAATTFQYLLPVLTPTIFAVSPSAGPDAGGTRITINGEGFQAPAKVFFGTSGAGGGDLTDEVELTVIQVTFSQIIAITPQANGIGLPLKDSQVTARVLNLASNKDAVLPLAFRYGPGIQVTAVAPNEGLYIGGTRVTINGSGFAPPVTVSFAGVAARNIVSVSGTQIIAITDSLVVPNCGDQPGDTLVTNIDTGGDPAVGPQFIYRVPKPSIASLDPNPVVEGQTITIGVNGVQPTDTVRFNIGGTDLTANPVSPGVFSATVPLGLTFKTVPCVTGTQTGTQNIATAFDIVLTDLTTTCTDTLKNGITVIPTNMSCNAAVTPGTVQFQAIPDFGTIDDCTSSAPFTETVSNPGGSMVTISQPTSSIADFILGPLSSTTLAANGGTATFTVTFKPTATGPRSGTISITPGGGAAVTTTANGTGAGPVITSVSPPSGAAGQSIVIGGTGFIPTGLSVTIGGATATPTGATATGFTVVAPTGVPLGPADIVVTNANSCGTFTDAGGFTYTP